MNGLEKLNYDYNAYTPVYERLKEHLPRFDDKLRQQKKQT